MESLHSILLTVSVRPNIDGGPILKAAAEKMVSDLSAVGVEQIRGVAFATPTHIARIVWGDRYWIAIVASDLSFKIVLEGGSKQLRGEAIDAVREAYGVLGVALETCGKNLDIARGPVPIPETVGEAALTELLTDRAFVRWVTDQDGHASEAHV